MVEGQIHASVRAVFGCVDFEAEGAQVALDGVEQLGNQIHVFTALTFY